MVVGIEHIRELVETSIENVAKHHSNLLESGRIKFVVGDGRKGRLWNYTSFSFLTAATLY
jgi:protein-L-isoaspartate(D-aspartate) O-methyltransferase